MTLYDMFNYSQDEEDFEYPNNQVEEPEYIQKDPDRDIRGYRPPTPEELEDNE